MMGRYDAQPYGTRLTEAHDNRWVAVREYRKVKQINESRPKKDYSLTYDRMRRYLQYGPMPAGELRDRLCMGWGEFTNVLMSLRDCEDMCEDDAGNLSLVDSAFLA